MQNKIFLLMTILVSLKPGHQDATRDGGTEPLSIRHGRGGLAHIWPVSSDFNINTAGHPPSLIRSETLNENAATAASHWSHPSWVRHTPNIFWWSPKHRLPRGFFFVANILLKQKSRCGSVATVWLKIWTLSKNWDECGKVVATGGGISNTILCVFVLYGDRTVSVRGLLDRATPLSCLSNLSFTVITYQNVSTQFRGGTWRRRAAISDADNNAMKYWLHAALLTETRPSQLRLWLLCSGR